MIQPAQRTQLVKEYYFSKKLREIDTMNKNGDDIINLGIGNPDLLPPQTAIDELNRSNHLPGNNGYQSYKGIPELRIAFAKWYRSFYDVCLNPENEILPLMGSKEGIMHISMAFLNPGDKVLVPNPGYPTYRSVSQIVGAEVLEYNLAEENNWYPDFEQLEKENLQDVKLMWVNYPNMPTGQPASMALFKRLIEFGKKHEILIVNDNPYSFILNDNPLSIFSVRGANEIALELNSLSKSHNMAGFRIGMVAGNSEFINHILKIKSNMDSGMYKPLQLAAVKALESSFDWYQSINEEYAKRRELVYQIFDLVDAQYSKDQKGMFVWAKIPKAFKDAYSFSDVFLNEAKVFITPGTIFGNNGERFVRISLCSSQNKLQESIKRIEKVQIHNSVI